MKIIKMVPRMVYGTGTFENLNDLLNQSFDLTNGYVVFLIDSIHLQTGLRSRIKHSANDLLIDVDVSKSEPKTSYIDEIRDKILAEKNDQLPAVIVGIGGGASMDIAKAVSVMLTNSGSAADYQGWDLVKNPAIPKLGIPTLSGTGSEATRTAVLTGPQKKLGINSDQSMFNVVLLDPALLKTVEPSQEFYTGMDCFIHCVEALSGSFINAMGKAFATSAKAKVVDFFLKDKNYEDLMVASYLGGCSVAASEVGVCHAMSYGLSLVLDYRHGLANCLVFNQLDDYYGPDVKIFRKMLKKNKIELPTKVTKDVTPDMMEKMVEMTLRMEKPLTNALGEDWRTKLTKEKIIELYNRM